MLNVECLQAAYGHYNIPSDPETRREYQELADELEAERELFRRDAASRGLPRRAQYAYPPHLVDDMPDFVEWLSQYTYRLVNTNGSNNVDIDLQRLFVLPSRQAETYQAMWAYGNHYRVENTGVEGGFVTQDYGIASIFGAEDGRSAGVSMVGVSKEIIVVRYSAQRRVVFHGSWIRNDPGPRSSTKIDQYGFTVVRFNDRVARHLEPYVLPATVRQIHSIPATPIQLSTPSFDTKPGNSHVSGVLHPRLATTWVACRPSEGATIQKSSG